MRRRRTESVPLGPDDAPPRSISLSELRFSTPTICDTLPNLGAAVSDPSALDLHEDDWRQTELLAPAASQRVEANFAAIEEVVAKSDGTGYARMIVRASPVRPLDGVTIGRAALEAALAPAAAGAAVLLVNGQRVPGGFTYVGPATRVYGVEAEGVIEVVGLVGDRSDDLGAAVTAFAADNQLVIVDWPARRTHPPRGG